MDRSELQRRIRGRVGGLRLVCMALAAAVPAYVVVAALVVRAMEGGLLDPAPAPLIGALAFAAVALLFVAGLLEHLLRARASARAAGLGAEGMLQQYAGATIAGFALREAGSVIGLVTSMLSGEMLWAAAIGVLTIVAMFVAWPRHATVEAWLMEHRVVLESSR